VKAKLARVVAFSRNEVVDGTNKRHDEDEALESRSL
jgi:hypothetical protein